MLSSELPRWRNESVIELTHECCRAGSLEGSSDQRRPANATAKQNRETTCVRDKRRVRRHFEIMSRASLKTTAALTISDAPPLRRVERTNPDRASWGCIGSSKTVPHW